jgi:hypothetical protein
MSSKILNRIQVRFISRQKFQLDSASGSIHKIFHHAAAVRPKTVPNHNHVAMDVPKQVLQKLNHLRTLDRSRVEPEIVVPLSDSNNIRKRLPIEMVLQHRSLTFQNPGAIRMRPLAQSAIVDKNYCAFLLMRFFKLSEPLIYPSADLVLVALKGASSRSLTESSLISATTAIRG